MNVDFLHRGDVCVEPLKKGWSDDVKYIVTTTAGERMLLRLSPLHMKERKQRLFEWMRQAYAAGLPIPEPIEIGQADEQTMYILQGWIEGEDAEDAVGSLSDQQAYALGLTAGEIMRSLHQIPTNAIPYDWGEAYQRKLETKIQRLRECGRSLPKQELLFDFINEHLHLVSKRPLVLTHGDYHLGNMIMHQEKLHIIDFDRHALADPYNDFKPFVWNAVVSPSFESGMIDGYFPNDIPQDFFPIFALYAAESMVSSLPWAVSFGEQEVQTAYRNHALVLKWFEDFTCTVPTWYHSQKRY